MAINYLSSINLNKNEIQNVKVQNLATAPANPVLGQIYYDTTDNVIYVCVDADPQNITWASLSGDITSVVAGSGLSDGGVTGDVTVNIGQGDGITINPDNVAVNAEATQFSFVSGVLTISTGAIGSDELAATAVTAGSYGSATEIPTFTVDADGRLTAASTATISTSFDIAGDTGTDTVNTGETVTFTGGTNITTAVTDNEVTINLDDSITLAGDLVVEGNFTVSGAVQTKISETVLIEDNIITLNSNEAGSPTEDSGIEVERGTSTNVSLIWDESASRWTFTNDGSTFYNIPVPSEYDNFSFSVSDGSITQEVSNSGTITFSQGGGLSVAVSGDDTVTYAHADTSSVADVDNSGLTVVQDLTFDTYGHVQTVGSQDITSSVDARITAREYKTSIGDGVSDTITVTHNLGTKDIIVQLFDNSSYDTVYADVVRSTTNTIVIGPMNPIPSTNDIRVLITKIG
jgi:hypothetical protein